MKNLEELKSHKVKYDTRNGLVAKYGNIVDFVSIDGTLNALVFTGKNFFPVEITKLELDDDKMFIINEDVE